MDRGSRLVRAANVVAVVAGVFAPSGRTQRLLISLAVVMGALVVPGAASAFTSAGTARQELIQANLQPRPLYPDFLPDPFWTYNGATFTHGHFFVWKGTNRNPEWFSIRYRCRCLGKRGHYLAQMTFSRGPVSDIAKAINLSQHVQGRAVGRVRVRGRHLYRVRLDRWFGYMWRQQGFAYSVFARYSRRVSWSTVRQFVESLRPLGRLWIGRTSQGKPISLYRSHGGVDWVIRETMKCADGSELPFGNEGLIGVHRNGMFADWYFFPWKQKGIVLHETLSIRGKFPAAAGGSVTGSFASHNLRAHRPHNRFWNCGARATWRARQFVGGT